MILISDDRYQTAKSDKTDKKIPHKSYQGRKDKIIDKGISVVFEEEAVHKGLKNYNNMIINILCI